MRIAIGVVSIVLLAAMNFVVAEDKSPDPLTELDAKIAKKLSSDKWSDASKAFVQAMWADYKTAHTANKMDRSTKSTGNAPAADLKDYESYVGKYQFRGKPFEVIQDAEKRFFVKLEKHTIPAVATNMTIVFTTGDVVYSRLPKLGEKDYATLEYFMVIGVGGKVYFGQADSRQSEMMELNRQ